MKELSLNILDIAQNSVKANASLIGISIDETDDVLSFKITDNGKGMTADFLSRVTDPFTTTRTTRKVGLGLPLLKMEAEMTGGSFSIKSKSETEYKEHGTEVFASFNKKSIDYIPLGDIIDTLCTLVQGAENTDFIFNHKMPCGRGFPFHKGNAGASRRRPAQLTRSDKLGARISFGGVLCGMRG